MPFNQDVSGWNTAAALTFVQMFFGAASFNNGGVALSWGANTGGVTSMSSMFHGATAFNQDISSWNTGAVTSMANMFYGASAFDNGGQPLAWEQTLLRCWTRVPCSTVRVPSTKTSVGGTRVW